MIKTMIKVGGEGVAVAGVGTATAFQWIPALLGSLASIMGIIWIGIQMYDYFKNKKKL